MEKERKFDEINPITYGIKHEKKKLFMSVAGLIIYAAALICGFIWFDWKLIVFVILFCWGNNLGIITSSIMPLQKSIAFMHFKEKVQAEIDKAKNPRR